MARTPRGLTIASRESRSHLAVRTAPYWRQVVPCLYVGYRKQVRGAKWLTKRKVAGRYVWEYLGIADDFMEAPSMNNVEFVRGGFEFDWVVRILRGAFEVTAIALDVSLGQCCHFGLTLELSGRCRESAVYRSDTSPASAAQYCF